jgi:hypothetical protein
MKGQSLRGLLADAGQVLQFIYETCDGISKVRHEYPMAEAASQRIEFALGCC